MKNIFYLLIFVFLSSCTIQKAYIVNPPNVNCFQFEKEKNLKVAINNLSLNTQFNVALNKMFGLSSSLYGGFGHFYSNSGFGGLEIGGIFYKYLTNKKYFELQAGYGFCSNKLETGWPTDPFSFLGLHGTSFDCETNTNYHKLYLQPVFYYIGKKTSIGFALKFNTVYYNKYYYKFNQLLDDGDGEGSDGREEREGTIAFNDKYGFVYEPVINIKFGSVFFIQFAGAISNNIVSGKAYEYLNGRLSTSQGEFTFSNPQHTYFKINAGLEFKLGKNKKPIIHE